MVSGYISGGSLKLPKWHQRLSRSSMELGPIPQHRASYVGLAMLTVEYRGFGIHQNQVPRDETGMDPAAKVGHAPVIWGLNQQSFSRTSNHKIRRSVKLGIVVWVHHDLSFMLGVNVQVLLVRNLFGWFLTQIRLFLQVWPPKCWVRWNFLFQLSNMKLQWTIYRQLTNNITKNNGLEREQSQN